jgi:hypothetical protein
MIDHQPAELFLKFFRWYCRPEMAKYIEGDQRELHKERVSKMTARKARLRFIIDVMLLFRPGIVRTPNGLRNTNHFDMIGNYLKVGWRMLLRSKGYSAAVELTALIAHDDTGRQTCGAQ